MDDAYRELRHEDPFERPARPAPSEFMGDDELVVLDDGEYDPDFDPRLRLVWANRVL